MRDAKLGTFGIVNAFWVDKHEEGKNGRTIRPENTLLP